MNVSHMWWLFLLASSCFGSIKNATEVDIPLRSRGGSFGMSTFGSMAYVGYESEVGPESDPTVVINLILIDTERSAILDSVTLPCLLDHCNSLYEPFLWGCGSTVMVWTIGPIGSLWIYEVGVVDGKLAILRNGTSPVSDADYSLFSRDAACDERTRQMYVVLNKDSGYELWAMQLWPNPLRMRNITALPMPWGIVKIQKVFLISNGTELVFVTMDYQPVTTLWKFDVATGAVIGKLVYELPRVMAVIPGSSVGLVGFGQFLANLTVWLQYDVIDFATMTITGSVVDRNSSWVLEDVLYVEGIAIAAGNDTRSGACAYVRIRNGVPSIEDQVKVSQYATPLGFGTNTVSGTVLLALKFMTWKVSC